MRSLFALPLFYVLVCSSCAASRNIEIKEQVDYSNELQNIRSSLDSLQWSVHRQSQVTTDKLSNLKVENKTIYLSTPDSTGKQHVVKQSITNVNKEEKEHKQEYEALSNSLVQISTQIDSLYNKVNELTDIQEVVKELSWWDLHKDKIYGGILVIFLILFVIYKRK